MSILMGSTKFKSTVIFFGVMHCPELQWLWGGVGSRFRASS